MRNTGWCRVWCSADGNYEVSYKPNVVLYHSGDVLWNMTSLQRRGSRWRHQWRHYGDRYFVEDKLDDVMTSVGILWRHYGTELSHGCRIWRHRRNEGFPDDVTATCCGYPRPSIRAPARLTSRIFRSINRSASWSLVRGRSTVTRYVRSHAGARARA